MKSKIADAMRKSQSNFISQFGSNLPFGSNDPRAPLTPK